MSSSADEGAVAATKRGRTGVWVLVAVLALMVAGPLTSRVVRRSLDALGAYSRVAEALSGEAAETADAQAFASVVPTPEGYQVLGVTDVSDSTGLKGVVGLVRQGSVEAVATDYLAAMEDAGWKRIGTDSTLGLMSFQRTTVPKSATVIFREAVSGKVTVVVQVQ